MGGQQLSVKLKAQPIKEIGGGGDRKERTIATRACNRERAPFLKKSDEDPTVVRMVCEGKEKKYDEKRLHA